MEENPKLQKLLKYLFCYDYYCIVFLPLKNVESFCWSIAQDPNKIQKHLCWQSDKIEMSIVKKHLQTDSRVVRTCED